MQLKKVIIICSVTFIITAIVALSFNAIFLTKNKPIATKTIVIEGWLQAADLENLYNQIDLSSYQNIYVSGISHPHPDFLMGKSAVTIDMPIKMYTNGCVVAYFCAKSSKKNVITINARGSWALNYFSNIIIALDDSIIGSTFLRDSAENYTFHFDNEINDSSKLYIFHNNDCSFENNDRNAIINSIKINNISIKGSDLKVIPNTYVDDSKYVNYPFRSNAHFAQFYLKALGVKSNIILVDTLYNKRNKTLIAAINFNNYLKKYRPDITSYNVVSINHHSLRTYLAHIFASNPNDTIGIISIEGTFFYDKNIVNNVLQLMDEYISCCITIIEGCFLD